MKADPGDFQFIEQSELIRASRRYMELSGDLAYHLVSSQGGMVDKNHPAVALILVVQFTAQLRQQAGFAVTGMFTDQQCSPLVGDHCVFQANEPLLMLFAQIEHIRVGSQ